MSAASTVGINVIEDEVGSIFLNVDADDGLIQVWHPKINSAIIKCYSYRGDYYRYVTWNDERVFEDYLRSLEELGTEFEIPWRSDEIPF